MVFRQMQMCTRIILAHRNFQQKGWVYWGWKHFINARPAITKADLDTNVETLEYKNKGEKKQDGIGGS